ncbi:hypothetical protein HDU84_003854 [Entophlyctis sp. JEL0112]|nr:hypothetical protein HDU84_003854 [Entophlyctis sp. JEL0112]
MSPANPQDNLNPAVPTQLSASYALQKLSTLQTDHWRNNNESLAADSPHPTTDRECSSHLAARLLAAEERANALIVDVMRVRREADELRRIIMLSGQSTAMAMLPPKTRLSSFASAADDQACTSAIPVPFRDAYSGPLNANEPTVDGIKSEETKNDEEGDQLVFLRLYLVFSPSFPRYRLLFPLSTHSAAPLMDISGNMGKECDFSFPTGTHCAVDVRIYAATTIRASRREEIARYPLVNDSTAHFTTRLSHLPSPLSSQVSVSAHVSTLLSEENNIHPVLLEAVSAASVLSASDACSSTTAKLTSSDPLAHSPFSASPRIVSRLDNDHEHADRLEEKLDNVKKNSNRKHQKSHCQPPVPPTPDSIESSTLSGSKTDSSSLAWTDIIRTRYPNFQRSTVQTSKHAREFIEGRHIPFFRVTPTHSLGRSKPTYAIPSSMHAEFLEYFEERFGGSVGVLGRRRVGGDIPLGMPGFDDATAVAASAATAAAAASAPTPTGVSSPPANADSPNMLEPAASEGTPSFSPDPLVAPDPPHARPKRRKASSASTTGGNVSVDMLDDQASSALTDSIRARSHDLALSPVASSGKKRKVTDAVVIPVGSKVVMSRGGVALTRYNTIVNKMMPAFRTLSNDARLAIKRGVKQFLQLEMGPDFDECVMLAPSENGMAAKQTYGVPEHLLAAFQDWAFVELKKCFPEFAVLPPKKKP